MFCRDPPTLPEAHVARVQGELLRSKAAHSARCVLELDLEGHKLGRAWNRDWGGVGVKKEKAEPLPVTFPQREPVRCP